MNKWGAAAIASILSVKLRPDPISSRVLGRGAASRSATIRLARAPLLALSDREIKALTVATDGQRIKLNGLLGGPDLHGGGGLRDHGVVGTSR